jgi:hypothetical protein
MNQSLKVYLFSSLIYVILIVGSIAVLDLIDNAGDKLDPRSSESDKMLILQKSETYRFYKDDPSLILATTISMPISSIISLFSGHHYSSEGFYLENEGRFKQIEIWGKVMSLITYVLMPILWLVYSIRFLKLRRNQDSKTSQGTRFVNLIVYLTLIIGLFLTSTFAVRATFENFKGFF